MYIGTDLGTTACKTVMYDSEGNVLSEYNREYGLIIRDSFVEQDARHLFLYDAQGQSFHDGRFAHARFTY